MAFLVLFGASAGIHFGLSAIGEINPIHFAEDRTVEALKTERQYRAGHNFGCIGCSTYPEEYRPLRDPDLENALVGASPGGPELAAGGAPSSVGETAADARRPTSDLEPAGGSVGVVVTAAEQIDTGGPAPDEVTHELSKQ